MYCLTQLLRYFEAKIQLPNREFSGAILDYIVHTYGGQQDLSGDWRGQEAERLGAFVERIKASTAPNRDDAKDYYR